MSKQQDLIESAGRNLSERINAIKEDGDGYMTVLTAEETKLFLQTHEAKRETMRHKK
jgi:hypothetical protein